MDIANLLTFKYPGARWSLHGNEYDGLIWLDEVEPKPTLQDIESANDEYVLHVLLSNVKESVKNHLDLVAQQKDYEHSLSIVTYKDSTNVTWKAEADAFIAWRDSVWQYCYNELAKFQSGTRPIVTPEEFINELPAIVWRE